MKPKTSARSPELELFRQELVNLLDQRHALFKLANRMDWAALEQRFGVLYADEGRPGVAIRLMVGLHYLKHAYNLSDEAVVCAWVENPYWQYFCGEQYFVHRMPIDASQMTRFRARVGEAGCEFLLKLTIEAGVATKTVVPKAFEAVNVDTTVQEKAIAHPTDARLYHKARAVLVREAKRVRLALRQSYVRLSRQALAMQGRYARAQQFKRARREQRRLRVYLGRVLRDIERKLPTIGEARRAKLEALMQIAWRIYRQQRTDNKKLYSVHAPEVECLAKGKVHKRYEFGVKVSVASTSQSNFVVGMRALPGNPYDGHTLNGALEQVGALTGVQPQQVFVDRGYRGHDADRLRVWIAGTKRGLSTALRKRLKRRNAIEPIIGHMKSDGRLARNFLKGAAGDAMNALLAASGHNLRKILRHLAHFCASILLAATQRQRLHNAQAA